MLQALITIADEVMKPLKSKQAERRERKKKKLAAYLKIAKLNDNDKEVSAILPPLTMMCSVQTFLFSYNKMCIYNNIYSVTLGQNCGASKQRGECMF
jgi:hypothetical protein